MFQLLTKLSMKRKEAVHACRLTQQVTTHQVHDPLHEADEVGEVKTQGKDKYQKVKGKQYGQSRWRRSKLMQHLLIPSYFEIKVRTSARA